jgi:hypothetical protein
MTATVTHGVLEVRVPKRTQAARDCIEVQTDEPAPAAGAGHAAAGTNGPGAIPVRQYTSHEQEDRHDAGD